MVYVQQYLAIFCSLEKVHPLPLAFRAVQHTGTPVMSPKDGGYVAGACDVGEFAAIL